MDCRIVDSGLWDCRIVDCRKQDCGGDGSKWILLLGFRLGFRLSLGNLRFGSEG